MTRIVKANIPFIILGVPVYRDYRVVHQTAAPSHLSFMHGYDDTKGKPEADYRVGP